MLIKNKVAKDFHTKLKLLLVLTVIGARGDITSSNLTTATQPDERIASTQQSFSVNHIQENPNIETLVSTTPASSTRAVLKTLGEFQGLSHDIKSGPIELLDPQTIFIPNFYFDGNAPDAHFSVGKGRKVTDDGTFVSLENEPETPLQAYHGQHVTLKLPNNLTFNDVDWLAVWCVVYKQNLGFVMLNAPQLRSYPPQTFGLKKEVQSGPIVLVNKTTIFIPNLRYSGNYADTHFWIGNGSEPNFQGFLVPDENNATGNLKPYNGQNIYLALPDNFTTDNVEYFGIFSRDKGVNLGHVLLDKSLNVPTSSPQVGENIVMRIPKCCELTPTKVLSVSGCIDRDVALDFIPYVNVSEHNNTHINTDPLDPGSLIFEPYYHPLECTSGQKYPLDESIETFSLLKNGSLIVKGSAVRGVLSQGDFCVDNVQLEDDDSDYTSLVLVCAPENRINHAMFHTYLTLTIISTICFAGAFFTYYFILTWDDIHRKCFTAYALCMGITFFFLIIVQVAHIENKGCEVIGFLFQLSMISSFTWLGILCFDIFFMVKYYEDKMSQGSRMKWYWVLGAAVPLLSLFVSLVRNLTPDVPNSFFKPQYGSNTCYFEAEEQRRVYFYVPIIISIVISAGLLIVTKFKIVRLDREAKNSYFWIENGQNYKFMLRQCLITLVIMTVCWISNVLMSFVDDSSDVFNTTIIIEALQGVLIVALFTCHHIGSKCRRYLIIWITMMLWLLEGFIHLYYASTTLLMAIDIVEATQGIIILLLFVLSPYAKAQIMEGIQKRKRRKRKNRPREEDVILKPLNNGI